MEAAENRLESILCSPTIHIEELKRELSFGNYTNEEINIAAWRYVEFCVVDCFDINTEYPSRKEGEMIEGRPSCHLYEVMEILLGFGMDARISIFPTHVGGVNRSSFAVFMRISYFPRAHGD